ncbi:flagellar basal body rod protein FlgG [Priestia megaterium]|uniref:flagellar basal body rod protein FlgG n=1 Tax=Priestia megaterium TaxID=1404 RepID=UPI000470970F|nr:flagellar basal body rod protein FlgG [Priestia megaterium]PFA97082.1 flagellar basal-body rod protein FlgF [Priestia megaterium]PFR95255.1 flagellar basal-body rod protein FlgF [Priestia megaterium]TCN15909.1 flagellar hook protein FlgE [Bacillus sp. BK006]
MLRSMYSGISGMKNFQTKLDVLGNNIANVNTYGYKKGRTTFQDLVSQQVAGATGPAGNRGGVNAKQVGLGSQIGTIDTVQTAGSIQSTGRPLDLAISGDGYFVVNDGTSDYYTRAGNFYLDKDGYLVTGDGLFVKSTSNNDNGRIKIDPTTAKSYSIGANGTINIVGLNGTMLPNPQTIKLAKFANNEGLQKAGGNLFANTPNAGLVGTPANIAPGNSGTGTLISSALEMSNVDLSEEFTDMIVAQRGFQANTRIITTSDEILQELVNLKR